MIIIINFTLSIIFLIYLVNKGDYNFFKGFAHLAAGICCGLSSLAAGLAIGIVGDAGVRANA
jgi:V-type H+-transporting ATPase proteolipid subunit